MSLVHRLKRWIGSSRRGSTTRPKRKSWRPELEALEERSTPSALSVSRTTIPMAHGFVDPASIRGFNPQPEPPRLTAPAPIVG